MVDAWSDSKPSEGKRAARAYLAAQLQATCMHPDMAGPRGVEMLEDAIDACPEAAKIPEQTTGRTPLLLLCDRDDIHADQLQVLAKIILSAYPPASNIQVRVKGPQGGYRYDTNPIHEACERADATPGLLDVLLDGVDESTLGQRDSRKRTPLHVLLANPSVRVHTVPESMMMDMPDDQGQSSRDGPKPAGVTGASARKAALEQHEGWLLAFLLGAKGGTSIDNPRLAMQDEHGLTPLHALLRNRCVSAPFLAPAIYLLRSAMDYENESRRDKDNSFKLRDERSYGVLHTLCERRDFITTMATSEAVEVLEAIIGRPDLTSVGISMNEVQRRGIPRHPVATVEDGSRPQGYLPLHSLVKSGSQMSADRLARLLVPMALANREAVPTPCPPQSRLALALSLSRSLSLILTLRIIADRRDVDSRMLGALVQACPESVSPDKHFPPSRSIPHSMLISRCAQVITKDNRGCTPLHSLLENVMLSHAYTRQQKEVEALKEAIVERDAAIPLQCLLRRWLVRGSPPPPLDPTATERLQKKKAGVQALRPWLEPLVAGCCNGSDVVELARLTAAAGLAASTPASAEAEQTDSTVPAADPATTVSAAGVGVPLGPLAGEAQAVPAASVCLRWQDVESALVELADPAKLRDAAKLVPDSGEKQPDRSAVARAEFLMKLATEVGFDAVQLVRDALSTRDSLNSLAIAKLKPRLAESCKADENSYLIDLGVEDDLDWETDAVPAMRLIMNLQQMMREDPDTWRDQDSTSGSDSEDDWEDSVDESQPATLDQLLNIAMLRLHDAEAEAEHMVKLLVDADARDEHNNKVRVTMEQNEAEQIPLRVLLKNTFVAQPVMTRLLGFLSAKDERSAIQPGANFPFRNPLLLLCADKHDVTADMVAAVVKAAPATAAVTDAYDFDAMQIVIERQSELRLDARRLTDILAVLAEACPSSVTRREVPKMAEAANWKKHAKVIGKRCGRSPVHMVCERPDVTPEMIEALVSRNDQAYVLQDDLGRTPLHTLCENPRVNGQLVRTLLKIGVAAAWMADSHGLTPLQSVCKCNPGCSVQMLQLLAFAYPGAAGLPDERGQTAAHLLSLRTDIKGQTLELMLQVVARAAQNELILQDHAERATALHYLCRRADVTPQMLSTILRYNSRVASKQDRRRRTALHWLCMAPHKGSESDVSEELIQVFVSKEKFELPVLSSLPKILDVAELGLDPDFTSTDTAESEPLAEEANREGELEPEPEHEMEYGAYAIQDALELTDLNGRTALHYLCRREDMKPSQLEPLVRALANAKPQTVCMRDCVMDRQARSFKQGLYNPDRSPLHELLRRSATYVLNVGGGITEALVSALLMADESAEHRSNCGAVVDFFGRSAFHIVCSREDLGPQLRDELLTAIVEAAPSSSMILDDFSEGGLHTLCGFYEATEADPDTIVASITPRMVSRVLEANPHVLDLVDVRGMTAFMHLCANPYVTPELIEAWIQVKPNNPTEIPRRLSGDHDARLKAIFLATDLDGNGELSADELADGARNNGELARLLNLEDGSAENIDAIFDAMDGNQNGLIDMSEFVNFFESEPVVQAVPPQPGKGASKSPIQPATKAVQAGPQHAALSFVVSMRRSSAVNNDVVVPEEEFLLPEELAAESPTMGSQEQEEEQDRVDYSGGWRAAKALLQSDRVGVDGKGAPASCRMQLVVRRSKAQDRWKMKSAGGVKRLLATALVSAAAMNTEEMEYPYMAVADAEHGRTALHWLCMNRSIKQRDLVKMLAAVGKWTRSTISALTTEPPFVSPLHLVVTRDDAHADMLRPLVRFRREAAAVRDQMGWLPIQLIYTKPGFKSQSAAAMLDLLAEAYPDGCMEPAPNTLIQNLCALHVICAAKDVGIESLRAVVNHCPGAAGLRDEHMMVPLHYLCKSTSICSSFQSLQERLGRTKHRVNTNTFRLIHLLLQKFSEELCRFVHLNHPTQDPDAAEQCRQRWDDNWRTRELPPELLTQITRDSTGHLADSWRDWVCDILAPLAALLIQVCSQCTPQPNIPGPVFKLHYPHARMRANWSSFVGDVLQYMNELQKLATEWSGPDGRSFAAKQPIQTPGTYYGYVHAATRAAAYYAKSDTGAADRENRSAAAVRPTRQQRAKFSAAAEAVQYPSLSAWPAEKHVQFDKSGGQAAFGHGRAATMSNASRDGHGSVAQDQAVARKVEGIMRKTRKKPRRASHKQQRPGTDFGVPAPDSMPVFQLRQEDLREPVRVGSPSEESRSEVAAAEAEFAHSVSQMRALEEEIDLARVAVVQMIEELSRAHPAAAQVCNRYGRTPLHFLALNPAVPPVFLPAMLRALIKCDRSVLLLHALATIETVVKGKNAALQNQRHRTPLHCVIERDDLTPAMVEACVVPPGEDSAAKEVDYWGNTPLQAMLLRRDLDDDVIVEVAKLLAKASAACLSVVNTAGLTALHMLVESTLSTDAMTRALALLCAAADADAIATQEHSDADLGFVGPFTDAQRASFSFKPNDRIDVWLDGEWHEATVEQYTPQGLSRPWRIEYKLVDGGVRGAFLLEDDYECVRKAHYRVGDLVDIDTDGQWRPAKITSYTPQFEDDPWRAEFAFTDTGCNTVGALLLDDDFEKIRIHQSTASITSVRRAAWALRAAVKVNQLRRQKQAEMRHSRQARRKIHGTTRRTVLHLVCARTDVHAGMIKAVLRGGSSDNPCATLQDSDGCTALHRLCAQRSVTLETIRAYLNGINGSDAAKAVVSQDASGSTPLHRLCARSADTARLPDMIAELVSASADAVDTVDDERCTPLHYLVNRADITPQMVDALVSQKPASTTIQDTIGRTALHKLTAAKHLSLPLLRALLPPQGTLGDSRDEISATLACAQDVEGRTALHMVCRRRGDFDVDENGQSTLDLVRRTCTSPLPLRSPYSTEKSLCDAGRSCRHDCSAL